MGQGISNVYQGIGNAAQNLAQTQIGAQFQGANAAGMSQQAQANANKELLGLGLLGAAAFSDVRLKDDIVLVPGSRFEQLGLRGVVWRWNTDATEKFGLRGHGEGVIAQEVANKYPEAVWVRNGYLTVDYSALNRMIRELR